MSKSTLFLIYAETCPACKFFKENYRNNLMKEISNRNILFKEINLEHTGMPLPQNYPKDLQKYVMWFPTFILANTKSLESNNVIATVFNGDYKNGKLTMSSNRIPPIPENILKWLDENIKNNPEFFGNTLVTKRVILDNEIKGNEKVVFVEDGKILSKNSKYYSYDFI